MFSRFKLPLDIIWILSLGIAMLFYQNCAPQSSSSDSGNNKLASSKNDSSDEYRGGNYEDPYEYESYVPAATGSSAGSSGRTLTGESAPGGSGGGSTTGSGSSTPDFASLCYAGQYAFSNSEIARYGNSTYLRQRYAVINNQAVQISDPQKVVNMPAGSFNDMAQKSCNSFVNPYGIGSNPFNLPYNCNTASGTITFRCRGLKYQIAGHNCSCASIYTIQDRGERP